jgi:cytochrome c-type biogenesis protein CcmF
VRLVARNRRRYGGYIVHAGVVILFCAFAGLAFKRENDVTLKAGETFQTTDPYGHAWRFVSEGLSVDTKLNRRIVAIGLKPTRDGKPMPLIESEKRQYFDSQNQDTFEPATVVGIQEGLRQDVYVVLAGVVNDDTAEVRITFNPLVWWVWYGGMIMAIGGLIVMWPQAGRRKESGYAAVMETAGVK